ncbi:mannonate dehydratase [Phocaeicola abscessus]|uniref:mannonate dehydratase n=1 Tax=Phocaeicola abscessus TaxID=555313 RepID=UPI0003859B8C|nr:mannonate dehydratase [Phocaeicola abscessus]EPT33029.1 mannonate dehydratase [Bacteroidetes bacterium oral taxon 272 str. F0290]
MEKTWRWFGPNDKITLAMLRQIGVEGIVTALHHIPNGEVWSYEEVMKMKHFIEAGGLRWSVVESLPVSESIKYGGRDRDELIENYIVSLTNLGKAGVRTICYNFMPVLDWARTDLAHPNPNGTTNLYFSHAEFAYFDICILKREGAEKSWSKEILEEVEKLKKTMTPEDDHQLVENIIVKTQGFVSGNIKEDDRHPVELFRRLLDLYKGITRDRLRENMRYFLAAIMPTCSKYDMYMCVHPDDPPFQILGLPRIVTCDDDIDWFLKAVDDPHNGLTFCAGSLSARAQNDVVELARKYAERTWFVHLRSCHVFPNGDFTEASHLGGRADIIELVRIFEKANPHLPMRVDHGMTMLGDAERGYNAGYSFLGRMFAMGQVQGILATVDRELGMTYRQPGFYD